MRATTQRIPRALVLCSCLALLVFLVPRFAAAADQSATTGAATPPKTKTAKAKPATPASAALTEDAALATFDAFTIEWMKKLTQTEEFHRTQTVKVTESAEGFAAEYVGYLPHRYIVVKKTSSPETPFVGILTYFEKTLRCVGKTREEALRGPFDQTATSQVSEIFRFTRGKWEY
ncbi:MAG: hypothetical protein HYZ72_04545 [Deltaproteobacteria bacterium]|nr:hypothetical protein [Deltaproteobacteria bacterium]